MQSRKVNGFFLLLISILVVGIPHTAAQVSITASLDGYVTDSSGATIPGATVTAIKVDTGLTRTAPTLADGSYTLPDLPIGTYILTVSKNGFQTFKQTDLVLTVDQRAQVNVSLQVGQMQQTIEVNAQASMVQSESSERSQLVDQERLADLPLNGRNPVQLISLVAGASTVSAPAILSGYRGGSTASVNGGRVNEENYLFDGNNYSSVYFNTGLNFPNPDALSEFRLITHSYSAEYGRDAGSVMDTATKSGTNGFHGDVWEFLRNTDLNARNFFSTKVPQLVQNQFGVVAGGPIKRNKVFWFGSYQGFRIAQSTLETNQPVATAQELAGNFSALTTPIIDPATGLQFPGNIIPPGQLNTTATSWYNQYVPSPNTPSGTTWLGGISAPNRDDQYLAKLDYEISQNQTLSGRWFYDKSTVVVPFLGTDPGYATGLYIVPAQDAAINYTWAVKPTLFNQAHVGLNHGFFDRTMTPNSPAFVVSNKTLGIDVPVMRTYSPNFSISGNISTSPDVESESGMSLQYGDTVTWVHKKHTFHFGMEVLVDDYHNRSFAAEQGSYSFTGAVTGNGLADFLLGLPASVSYHGAYIVDNQSKKIYPFVQDDWKVTPTLTLNLGFRWEFNQPNTDNSPNAFPDQQATWVASLRQSTVFPTATPGFLYPGDSGVGGGLYPWPKGNIEPRFGFAWNPGGTGKWVVRGAAGLFSDVPIPDLIGQTHADQPFVLITNLFTPAGGLNNPFLGFPGGDPWPFAFNPKNVGAFITPTAGETTANDFRDPRIGEWNLGVQRLFGNDWLVDVSYVASAARHLNRSIDGNPARYLPGNGANGLPLSTSSNIDSRRVYDPGVVSSIQDAEAVGNSSYQSLQFTVTKRMSQGLTFQSAYTWSHSLDYDSNDSIGGLNCQNEFNCSLDYGNSTFDRRQVYALSLLYDTPKLTTNNWAADHLLNNWEAASIFTAGTGTPVNLLTGKDDQLDGENIDRPNLVGNPAGNHSSRNAEIHEWFNPAAFVANPIGVPGTNARDNIFSPGQWELDFSVLRDFPISEKYGRLQFRAEAFNIFNNVNLSGVTTSLQSSIFGHLTTAGNPRLVQFALKYYW